MEYRLTDKGDYLRADLLSRDSPADTEEFLNAVRDAGLKHASARVLIAVQSSHVFFRVEKFHASAFLQELASHPGYKVALLARHFEVRLLHQYIEVLARLKHANLRSFSHEPLAIRWLTRTDSPESQAVSETPR